MAAPTLDPQSTPTPARPDRAAVSHLVISTGFLVLGGLAWLLLLLEARFPSSLGGPLSYGRLRPMAMLLTVVGWLTIGLIAGIYHVLPRLTAAPLWREPVATAGGYALAALTLLGTVAVAFGFGDGLEPFGLPLALEIPLLVALLIPTAVTIATVARRNESNVFVTLWYVLAGVVWLPWAVAVAAIPGLGGLGATLQGAVATWGLANAWVVGAGTGLAYYALLKVTGKPLASRRLAGAGFWSLMFASAWAGPLQVVYGPAPAWLDSVSLLLTLALPVAALATATNIALTVDDLWGADDRHPTVSATLGGALLAVVAGVLTGTAGFRSAAAAVGLTPFWDGVLYLTLFGAGGLFLAAWAYQALPTMTGRALTSRSLARRHVQLTVVGTASTALVLVLAGLTSGFGWSGSAFTGLAVPTGEGWASLAGLPSTLLGLAILTGAITFAGQIAFALGVYRTITSGRATTQEVLVPRRAE